MRGLLWEEIYHQPSHWLANQLLPPTQTCHKVYFLTNFMFLRPFHQNLRPESKATEMWSHFFVLGILENSRSDATNVVFSGSESNYDYFTISRFSGKIDHRRGGLGWVKANLRTQWPIKSGADGNAALLHIFRHHVQTKRQGPTLQSFLGVLDGQW